MRKVPPPASPDAYVEALDGWRRALVERLRAAARSVDGLVEVIKWGHIVYLKDGPALLIRAEDERVLFGFWRGQRLRGIEPRLKPGGKYEMATLDLREGDDIAHDIAVDLARAAAQLNADLGRPDKAAGSD
jgi:hypothetical protein